MIKIAPDTALKFFLNDKIKEFVVSGPVPSLPERLTCGGLAGVTTTTCLYPLQLVKTRLALAKPGIYDGIYDCLFKIVNTDGVAGLYRGLRPL